MMAFNPVMRLSTDPREWPAGMSVTPGSGKWAGYRLDKAGYTTPDKTYTFYWSSHGVIDVSDALKN